MRTTRSTIACANRSAEPAACNRNTRGLGQFQLQYARLTDLIGYQIDPRVEQLAERNRAQGLFAHRQLLTAGVREVIVSAAKS